MKDEIKKEILELLERINLDLNDEESKFVDTYIRETINNLSAVIDSHNEILKDKAKLESFKKSILKLFEEE